MRRISNGIVNWTLATMAAQQGEDVQQLVKFVTKLPAELRVPETPVVRRQAPAVNWVCPKCGCMWQG